MRTKLPWRKDGVRQGAKPESVARAAVEALTQGRSEVLPGLGPKLLVLANRIAPRVVDWWMRRYVRR
jgi:short-subunit dehydrogenase